MRTSRRTCLNHRPVIGSDERASKLYRFRASVRPAAPYPILTIRCRERRRNRILPRWVNWPFSREFAFARLKPSLPSSASASATTAPSFIPAAGEEFAVTTDLSIAGRHFRLEWHPAESVGHRALARGLSDLAAMGARPVAAFLSLALPRNLVQSQKSIRLRSSPVIRLGRRFWDNNPRATTSSTVAGKRRLRVELFWGRYPILFQSPKRFLSVPKRTMFPAESGRRPRIALIKVVLPAPLGPARPTKLLIWPRHG